MEADTVLRLNSLQIETSQLIYPCRLRFHLNLIGRYTINNRQIIFVYSWFSGVDIGLLAYYHNCRYRLSVRSQLLKQKSRLFVKSTV